MEENQYIKLKKPLIRQSAMPAHAERKEILFMLSDTNDPMRATVTVVDHRLDPVSVDYRLYSGAVSNCIKTCNQILERAALAIEWGSDVSLPQSAVSLHEHPQVLYMLALCDNVVDYRGFPIRFSTENARIIYKAERTGSDDTDLFTSRFVAATPDNEPSRCEFLSDSFVIVDSMIYPVLSVGDNYVNLDSLCVSFSEAQLPYMLSIVLSYVDNITAEIDGYDVVMSRAPEKMHPTLVFENIDPDKALILRVTATLLNIPLSVTREFYITRAVTRSDHRLIVKDVETLDADPYINIVEESITKSAASRKDTKELYCDGDTFIVPESLAGQFILKGLPTILSQFRIIGSDKLRSYKIKPVTPHLSINLSSGIDFLEGTATVEVGDEQFTLSDLLSRYSHDHYVELSDGERAIFDEAYMKRLERIYRHIRGKKDQVRISFFDLPEIESLLNESITGPAVARPREVYEGFNRLSDIPLDLTNLKATLRAYQIQGVKWIKYLYENMLGGCLADDMGLGKTIQTITMLLQIYPAVSQPTLIVMPRSLIFNWENELDRFAPSLSHCTYYGTGRDLNHALQHQVILTTYAIMRNDIDELRKIDFHYVILDESQNIKNQTTQIARSTFLLRAAHRLAISGTPIENNLTELYSLFHFLNPTMFGSADEFNQYYTVPIQRDGDELAAEQLRRKVFPFILRRLKRDVLTDLPERMEQTLYVEMTPELSAFYERRRRAYFDQIHHSIASEGIQKSQMLILQALSELRRIASVPESLTDNRIASPKLELLSEQLENAVENGHKVVVFYNFIAGIELTANHLERAGIDFEIMTGATTNRRKVISRFQNDPNCKVLLMTLKTGGVGLNLTVADTVVIFEPWWNKAAEEQAINRLHRIGQKSTVISYSLFTIGTIEEKIRELQEKKSLLVDAIISSDSTSGKMLSEEDIDYILGPSTADQPK